MSNFLEEIIEAINGERVDGVSLGEGPTRLPSAPTGRVSWDEFQRVCDYEYDGGFGGEDCHPILVWTETRVLFVGCYDGATWIESVPRNPSDDVPKFVGGG